MVKVLTRKPLEAVGRGVARNPRARSAKLRGAEMREGPAAMNVAVLADRADDRRR